MKPIKDGALGIELGPLNEGINRAKQDLAKREEELRPIFEGLDVLATYTEALRGQISATKDYLESRKEYELKTSEDLRGIQEDLDSTELKLSLQQSPSSYALRATVVQLDITKSELKSANERKKQTETLLKEALEDAKGRLKQLQAEIDALEV